MTKWTTYVPIVSVIVMGVLWLLTPTYALVLPALVLLALSVLAAVHHAEIIALRVGEPFGSLVLAVAVTVIEVALIVSLIVAGGTETATLARDTVFAALMITINGIVGVSLLVAALRHNVVQFRSKGTSSALATVATLATLSLVLPAFTIGEPGPEFTPEQLAFAAVASLALYLLFVFVQTVRHRDYFLPPTRTDVPVSDHVAPPSNAATGASLALLLVSLVSVVGLAAIESRPLGGLIGALGAPPAAIGVLIALLVLMPETLAAVRNARRNRMQTSFNLALGSAMASIGLTIPAIAIASIWLDGPLALGLEPTQIVLLFITLLVAAITILPGRSTLQAAGVHLVLLFTFLFIAFSP